MSTSAQRKLTRGIEHVKALCGEATTFQNAHAYVLRAEREQRSAEEVEYRCFAVEQAAPPDHWPLVAGDAIQNLRSALDHAVYSAANGQGKTQFPIFTDEREFKVKGHPMIAGTPEPVRALIEGVQPYVTIPQHPCLAPLAVLSRLSNLDKHRSLSTVACVVNFPFVGHSIRGRAPSISITEQGQGRTLGEGTPIMTFSLIGAGADKMDVKPDFTYEVSIEGIQIDMLDSIARFVRQVVTSIARRRANGDGGLELLRILKRRLSDVVYRALKHDAAAALPLAA